MVRPFPVSAGILEHKQRMGAAIWEFLWLIDHVTSDEPGEDSKFIGIVQFGHPISAEMVARDLKESIDTAKVNLRKLCTSGYVSRRLVVGAGYSYEVINSKKWLWKRSNGHRMANPLQVENPSTENLLAGEKKPANDRRETYSNNKESKTLLRHRKRTSSPSGEVDQRHVPIAEEIQSLWLQANPGSPAAPWNGRTASTLKRFLKDNPAWTSEQLHQCAINRFASDANHADDPASWIPRLLSYASGPLNQFNKPKGNGNGTGNRAERIQADTLQAVRDAKAAVRAARLDD